MENIGQKIEINIPKIGTKNVRTVYYKSPSDWNGEDPKLHVCAKCTGVLETEHLIPLEDFKFQLKSGRFTFCPMGYLFDQKRSIHIPVFSCE
jgi:hypothetical protein